MEQKETPKETPFLEGNTKYYYLAVILLLLFILIFWWWRVAVYPYQKTDDASIASVDHTISAVQSGKILQMAAKEGDVVKKGDLLFILDDALLQAEKDKAVAGMAHAKNGAQLQKLQLDLAKADFDRASIEFAGGVISKEMMDHAEKAYQMAQAQLLTILSLVQVQEATLKMTDLQLRYSHVTAPSDGVIAKRWHDPGDVIRAGQTVLSLIDLSQLWIAANIEETKLSQIKVGNPVYMTIDAYPDMEFEGRVEVIGAAAASQFALIPANNSSGNFTKITQRIPLKISFKQPPNAQKLYLRPGMSVNIRIRTR